MLVLVLFYKVCFSRVMMFILGKSCPVLAYKMCTKLEIKMLDFCMLSNARSNMCS